MKKALGLSHNGRGCFGSRFWKAWLTGTLHNTVKCYGISLVLLGYWKNMGSSGVLTLIFHSYDFGNGLAPSLATF